MDKKQVVGLLARYKYILIGENHKNNKIIFCLEIPKQAEKELYGYLNGKIKKLQLLNSIYLNDAKNDKRINDNILIMYRNLHKAGIIFKGLEDYNNENPYERDKSVAKRFMNITNNKKFDKYIL